MSIEYNEWKDVFISPAIPCNVFPRVIDTLEHKPLSWERKSMFLRGCKDARCIRKGTECVGELGEELQQNSPCWVSLTAFIKHPPLCLTLVFWTGGAPLFPSFPLPASFISSSLSSHSQSRDAPLILFFVVQASIMNSLVKFGRSKRTDMESSGEGCLKIYLGWWQWGA